MAVVTMARVRKAKATAVKSATNGKKEKEFELTALDHRIIELVKSMEKGTAKRKSIGDAVSYEGKKDDPYRHVIRTALLRLARHGYLKLEGIKAGAHYLAVK